MTQGNPSLIHVVINGISVDAYIVSSEITPYFSKATTKKLMLILQKAVNSIITVDSTLSYASITVQRGVLSATEKYVFRGYITNVETSGGLYIITAWNKLFSLNKKTITTSFDINIDSEAGVVSEIFLTLINDYSDLTATSATVQDSGTVNVLTKFKCDATTVFDRCQELAEAINWQFYYNDEDDLVYFEPIGFPSQSTTLESGVNILENPKWIVKSDEIINQVEMRGSVQLVETTVNGRIGTTTGYTSAYVQLDFVPDSVKVYADAVNPPTTLRVGGRTSVSTPYDYTVDKELKRIVWNTSTYAPTTDYVIVQYTYPVPAPVIIPDYASQSLYGVQSTVIHKNDITNVSDATLYGQQFINDWSTPLVSCNSLKIIDVSDLNAGQTVGIIDTKNNVVGTFVVVGVVLRYPYKYDEIKVINRIVDENGYQWNMQKRVKRLEEQNVADGSVLLHAPTLSRSDRVERRDFVKQSRTVTDGFILGHTTLGKLGTAELGTPTSTLSTVYIRQGDNTYREYVTDSDYYDSGASTGITWNTTTNIITIAASGVLYTKVIDLGTINSFATVEFGTVSASTYTIEISSDNKSNWQTLTESVKTSLTNVDDTGTYLRITNTGGVSITIQPYKDSFNEMQQAAINCLLEE